MANKCHGNVIRAAAGGLGRVTVIVLVQRKWPENLSCPVATSLPQTSTLSDTKKKTTAKKNHVNHLATATTELFKCAGDTPECPIMSVTCCCLRQSTGRLCDCPAVSLSGLERTTQEVLCPATSCYCVQTEKIPKKYLNSNKPHTFSVWVFNKENNATDLVYQFI